MVIQFTNFKKVKSSHKRNQTLNLSRSCVKPLIILIMTSHTIQQAPYTEKKTREICSTADEWNNKNFKKCNWLPSPRHSDGITSSKQWQTNAGGRSRFHGKAVCCMAVPVKVTVLYRKPATSGLVQVTGYEK